MSTPNHKDITTDTFNREERKQIEHKAIAYLARRDYSYQELEQRLLQKEFPLSAIHSVLDQLMEQGYQSDERFAEMYFRSRQAAGDGPFKIKIALRQKGVCERIVLSLFDHCDIDWLAQAKQLKNKKFGALKTTPEEQVKQIRYLKNKGYYQEHIQQALNVSFD